MILLFTCSLRNTLRIVSISNSNLNTLFFFSVSLYLSANPLFILTIKTVRHQKKKRKETQKNTDFFYEHMKESAKKKK